MTPSLLFQIVFGTTTLNMAESQGVTALNTPNTFPKLTKTNHGEWPAHMPL